jgi:hypothetical protein
MEKYGQWRDAGTGIAPFLVEQTPRASAAVVARRLVLVLAVLLLALPLLWHGAVVSWTSRRLLAILDIRLSVQRHDRRQKRAAASPRTRDTVVLAPHTLPLLDGLIVRALFGGAATVYPEAASSNGRGLLVFAAPVPPNALLLAVRHERAVDYGSALRQLLLALPTTVHVSVCPPDGDNPRLAMANAARLHLLSLSAGDARTYQQAAKSK